VCVVLEGLSDHALDARVTGQRHAEAKDLLVHRRATYKTNREKRQGASSCLDRGFL
jgi:hypothetical protein